jgi:hypothetical protein
VRRQVRRDALDVVHQRRDVPEDPVVHPLMKETLLGPTPHPEAGDERVMDVTTLEPLESQEFSVDGELGDDLSGRRVGLDVHGGLRG